MTLFDDIYVINLNKAKSRLNKINYQFNKYNLKYKRFNAIHGKQLDEDVITKNTNILCRTLFCSKNIVGTAMSHMKLWEKLLNDKSNTCYVILEDDVVIDANFKYIIASIDKLINDNFTFDILFLNCETPIAGCKHKTTIMDIDEKYKIGEPSFLLSTSAYIVSKTGAEKLLSTYKDNIMTHIDLSICVKGKISTDFKILSIYPNVVKTDGFIDSNIHFYNNTPIMLILSKLNKNLYWMFNISLFNIHLYYPITLFYLIILLLLFINIKYINSNILLMILIIEIVIYNLNILAI